MNRIRITFKFILHFLSAKNTRGFGVHSPYVFHFTKFVIYNKSAYYVFSSIEKIRSLLRKDKRVLNLTDFGTGNEQNKSIAKIVTTSLKPAKYGQLLYRLSDYIKARNVLELGTSLGITTSYLSTSSSEIKCVSLEGSPEIAAIAVENFNKLNIKNVQIVVGNIDITLLEVLNDFERLDLVFIDANHKSEAVLNYFNQCLTKIHNESILVLDDIYWSSDMEKAWETIKDHPRVKTTIDLFQLGIVFFNPDLYKKHYRMRF